MRVGYYQFGRWGTINTRSNWREIGLGVSFGTFSFGSSGVTINVQFLGWHVSYSVVLNGYGRGVRIN